MTLADKVTSLRLILAPFFFIVFLLPEIDLFGFGTYPLFLSPIFLVVLWALFAIGELTDLLDGMIARGRNEVSDFGKLYDPFADVLVRVTYFLCFVITGILPVIVFLVIIYRELGIQFIRVLMMKKGIAMGARWGGKIKAVCYMITGVVCLLVVTVERMDVMISIVPALRMAANIIFIISAVIAVISFVEYFTIYLKTGKNK